jgi:hypothetical protein
MGWGPGWKNETASQGVQVPLIQRESIVAAAPVGSNSSFFNPSMWTHTRDSPESLSLQPPTGAALLIPLF